MKPKGAAAPSVLFSSPLVSGQFVRRLNRFAALVRVAGREECVHVRNSGRLGELLTPGRRVLLESAEGGGRRTRFTLALIRMAGGYVSADAHLPNALVEAALRRGGLPGFRSAHFLRREPAMGRKRADFLVTHGGGHSLVEVKSVTLVVNGVALFPDAPTTRGRAHLEHLMTARRRGLGAAVLFVIQRHDALGFAPNRETDPLFADALRRAARAGVRVGAVVCRVTRRGVWLDRSVPVRLAPGPWGVGTSGPGPESS